MRVARAQPAPRARRARAWQRPRGKQRRAVTPRSRLTVGTDGEAERRAMHDIPGESLRRGRQLRVSDADVAAFQKILPAVSARQAGVSFRRFGSLPPVCSVRLDR